MCDTEEIEAVFKSGGSADQVITQALLKGANESIRNVYQNVADKYQVCICVCKLLLLVPPIDTNHDRGDLLSRSLREVLAI